MKKYLGPVLFIAAATSLLTGCASTKLSVKESSPVAIISITGNTQIPWVDEESEEVSPTGEPEAESLLTSMASSFTNSQNPEILTAIDRLDYAYDSANLNLLELAGYTVLPKEELLSSEAYTYMAPSYFNMLTATKNATGFKDLSILGAKNARYIMEETGAKSLLALSFTFQKELVRGTRSSGTVGGIVTMKAKILNSRGREVFNKIFVARTSGQIKIMHGQYNKETLIENLNDAIDDAMRQFCIELSKMSVTEAVPEAAELDEVQATPIKIPSAE
ncbi:MAG: hypothetical protein IJM48_08620 [Treponema sp.]|nr:hypothetical protein [Treponema sp.]